MGERLPRGVRKHIRNQLSEARKSGDPRIKVQAESVAAQLRGTKKDLSKPSRNLDEVRLEEVTAGLADKDITQELSAELRLESIWLNFKLNKIDSPTRRRLHQDLLMELLNNNPEGLNWLDQTVGYDQMGSPISRSSMIRDRVLNPTSRQEG